jgi:hypothetical protein
LAASSPATRRPDAGQTQQRRRSVSGGVVRLFARRLLARYGVGLAGEIVNHGGHASGSI